MTRLSVRRGERRTHRRSRSCRRTVTRARRRFAHTLSSLAWSASRASAASSFAQGTPSAELWYQERLGVKTVPESYEDQPGAAGGRDGVRAVRAGLGDDRPARARVDDQFSRRRPRRVVEQLRTAGETVEVDPERYPNGRFAELRDPEGNGIQLWQPMGPP